MRLCNDYPMEVDSKGNGSDFMPCIRDEDGEVIATPDQLRSFLDARDVLLAISDFLEPLLSAEEAEPANALFSDVCAVLDAVGWPQRGC